MLTSELREKAYQYIDGHISLEDLEDWLVPNEPEFLALPDSDDADVTGAIELGFADLVNRTRTEEEFRRDLKGVLAEHQTVLLTPVSNFVETGTESATQLVMASLSTQLTIHRMPTYEPAGA